jgi:hypothetical protein
MCYWARVWVLRGKKDDFIVIVIGAGRVSGLGKNQFRNRSGTNGSRILRPVFKI